MNRGTSQATVHGVTKSQTQVSNLAHTHLVVTSITPKMVSQEEKLKSAHSDHPARWRLFPMCFSGSFTYRKVVFFFFFFRKVVLHRTRFCYCFYCRQNTIVFSCLECCSSLLGGDNCGPCRCSVLDMLGHTSLGGVWVHEPLLLTLGWVVSEGRFHGRPWCGLSPWHCGPGRCGSLPLVVIGQPEGRLGKLLAWRVSPARGLPGLGGHT